MHKYSHTSGNTGCRTIAEKHYTIDIKCRLKKTFDKPQFELTSSRNEQKLPCMLSGCWDYVNTHLASSISMTGI